MKLIKFQVKKMMNDGIITKEEFKVLKNRFGITCEEHVVGRPYMVSLTHLAKLSTLSKDNEKLASFVANEKAGVSQLAICDQIAQKEADISALKKELEVACANIEACQKLGCGTERGYELIANVPFDYESDTFFGGHEVIVLAGLIQKEAVLNQYLGEVSEYFSEISTEISTVQDAVDDLQNNLSEELSSIQQYQTLGVKIPSSDDLVPPTSEEISAEYIGGYETMLLAALVKKQSVLSDRLAKVEEVTNQIRNALCVLSEMQVS